MSSSRVNLAKSLIPLKEIRLATQDFSSETRIGRGEFASVYRGQLSKRWQNQTAAFRRLYPSNFKGHDGFRNDLEMISSFNHENIIPFIGYCVEDNEMIIAFGYAINGSLQDHLQDPNKRRCLTWEQRLKICIGAAKGLEYLHSGAGESRRIIHKNIKATNILLDDNLEAKICDFGFRSRLITVHTTYVGNSFYMDPNYFEIGNLTKESDVYSFGVLLFETLSGMLANDRRSIEDRKPQTLMNLVRRHYEDGLDQIIDPFIRSQIDSRSFNTFKKIAYQCISFKSKDRPKMDTIIERIKEALDIQSQKHGAALSITIGMNRYENLERCLIPLKEVNLATGYKSQETCVGVGGSGVVYKGQLSEHWQNRTAAFKCIYPTRSRREQEFRNEVEMMSSFNHENIIPFIGYCDEGNERIIVSEYAINGSLDQHLKDPNKIRCLTWEQRLKICLGAARGLKYLHSGLGEQNKVIHRGVSSSNILLDGNLEAKFCCFVLAILVDGNQREVYEPAVGTPFYMDPIYNESGIVSTESDIYSFGVVLFEMLGGMLASDQRTIGEDEPQTLINLVRRYYHDGLENLIDPHIRDQINTHSFHAFKELAYQCISLKLRDRPTMNRIIKRIEEAQYIQNLGVPSTIATPSHQCQNLESFLIPLEEIKLATRDFSAETQIGDGGFGVVYRGQLSELWKNCVVAIKRLDLKSHQGKDEFLTELKFISSFHHDNIISFVGYCDEDNEMILVYEYASNHSLDHHLQDSKKRGRLTWSQRLKICLGVARGLNYIHSSLGEEIRVIHRDIKSGNILLDENMEAKICDFGLSKQSPRDTQGTEIYTKAAGTVFYLDPIYQESGILHKESDVYSFGVVLFEILSGMLAYHRRSFGDGNPQPLINLVRRYYNNGLEELIDPLIRDQIDSRCFHIFKELAFQCISYNFKERPTMETVIERIEDAIDVQLECRMRKIELKKTKKICYWIA
ncbi:uncharacterized protein LOC111882334 isoform X1 [Lactuca sativa]|uniref:uncharacterized protein LOC111882334 isoform X1 n=1 Tax=Lactuca sativa TaxID=4236 RepID=UPI000CD8A4D3|nr:uncharacterized protein LOC111882334 isoform X1 [Lactuca sativa]